MQWLNANLIIRS